MLVICNNKSIMLLLFKKYAFKPYDEVIMGLREGFSLTLSLFTANMDLIKWVFKEKETDHGGGEYQEVRQVRSQYSTNSAGGTPTEGKINYF
jgi:hypothetical protein